MQTRLKFTVALQPSQNLAIRMATLQVTLRRRGVRSARSVESAIRAFRAFRTFRTLGRRVGAGAGAQRRNASVTVHGSSGALRARAPGL